MISLDIPFGRSDTLMSVLAEYPAAAPYARDLRRYYDTVYKFHAPFVVHIGLQMFDDLLEEARKNPDFRAVFLGRDGPIYGEIVKQAESVFYEEHCRQISLPRTFAEKALQKQEELGFEFPQLAEYRKLKELAAGQKWPNFDRDMARTFQCAGIQPPPSQRRIVVIDNSYTGSIQEILAALNPHLDFHGLYAVHVGAASDPHPGSKTGYEVHLVADRPGANAPHPTMPDDPALTFTNVDALRALESVISGVHDKPTRLGALGPIQRPLSRSENPFGQVDPSRIADPLKHPVTREATKRIVEYAVADLTNVAIEAGLGSPGLRDELAGRAVRCRTEIRKWVLNDNPDPGLRELLDSLVKRTGVAIAEPLPRRPQLREVIQVSRGRSGWSFSSSRSIPPARSSFRSLRS